MKLHVKETVRFLLRYLCTRDSQGYVSTSYRITELAQRQWVGSFPKPVRQYGITLTRKDSLKHQPPRKNG